jgi:hypothetical protein
VTSSHVRRPRDCCRHIVSPNTGKDNCCGHAVGSREGGRWWGLGFVPPWRKADQVLRVTLVAALRRMPMHLARGAKVCAGGESHCWDDGAESRECFESGVE